MVNNHYLVIRYAVDEYISIQYTLIHWDMLSIDGKESIKRIGKIYEKFPNLGRFYNWPFFDASVLKRFSGYSRF